MKKVTARLLVSGILFCYTSIVFSQHSQHIRSDTMKMEGNHSEDNVNMDSTHRHMSNMPAMSYAFSLNLPMNRNGSGTGWLPDSTPMYGYMMHGKKWMYMFHGNIFVRYNKQDVFNAGTRGGEKFDAVNWFMGMGQRKVGSRG